MLKKDHFIIFLFPFLYTFQIQKIFIYLILIKIIYTFAIVELVHLLLLNEFHEDWNTTLHLFTEKKKKKNNSIIKYLKSKRNFMNNSFTKQSKIISLIKFVTPLALILLFFLIFNFHFLILGFLDSIFYK